MRPGRELDTLISREVFGREVYIKKRIPHEKTELGERPLRNYSKNIEHAWEVAEKMKITLIPVENNQWFAIVGPENGWKNPAEFLRFLHAGDFVNSGAAVTDNPALAICLAATKAVEIKKASQKKEELPVVLTDEGPHVIQ